MLRVGSTKKRLSEGHARLLLILPIAHLLLVIGMPAPMPVAVSAAQSAAGRGDRTSSPRDEIFNKNLWSCTRLRPDSAWNRDALAALYVVAGGLGRFPVVQSVDQAAEVRGFDHDQ